MKSFVDIKRVYTKIEERNIEYLSGVYQNKSYLTQVIESLVDRHLSKEEIFGKKILLKPNWVRHNIKEIDKICICTDENFILATLEILLKKHPQSIIIGDAPVQGCIWGKLLSQSFYDNVKNLSEKFSVRIRIKDFRQVIFNSTTKTQLKEIHLFENYLVFDVGTRSYLEPITNDKKLFRITNYDPGRLAESHLKGIHKYCVTKDLFDADLVITMPKIKTHQKAGITNAMKILVGINGDKDYLPHHRKGSPEQGGDCYPGKNIFRTTSEHFLDRANRYIGGKLYRPFHLVSSVLWRLSRPGKEQNLAAGWHGNDTVWRMVYDLNMVALYGKKDGTLAGFPQRKIYSLSDGIIGGQGNGPLFPAPLALESLSFLITPSWQMSRQVHYLAWRSIKFRY
jgi:uncharacterized protein (DUF362 family)